MSPKDVLAFAKAKGAQTGRYPIYRYSRVCSTTSRIRSRSSPRTSFEEGFGIDGSSIRGWAAINESDMLLIPDAATALMDPFFEVPTLCMVGDDEDPITRQRYDRDPRYIAQEGRDVSEEHRAGRYGFLRRRGGVLHLRQHQFRSRTQHSGFYFIDAEEGRWNSGARENNLGYRPRYKEGYFPVPPTDHYQDLRAEMVEVMESAGLDIECHHHEVATGGQCEIDQKYQHAGEVGRQHDAVQVHRAERGQPVRQDGDVHAEADVRRQRQRDALPPIAVEGRASRCLPATAMPGLSQMALWYIGGLLKHARALSAIIAPTTN